MAVQTVKRRIKNKAARAEIAKLIHDIPGGYKFGVLAKIPVLVK